MLGIPWPSAAFLWSLPLSTLGILSFCLFFKRYQSYWVMIHPHIFNLITFVKTPLEVIQKAVLDTKGQGFNISFWGVSKVQSIVPCYRTSKCSAIKAKVRTKYRFIRSSLPFFFSPSNTKNQFQDPRMIGSILPLSYTPSSN